MGKHGLKQKGRVNKRRERTPFRCPAGRLDTQGTQEEVPMTSATSEEDAEYSEGKGLGTDVFSLLLEGCC